VAIDDERMVLKITENAKKYALFTNADHKVYDNLPIHDLDAVIKFWVKKYKAHNTYQQTQAVANQYKSAAYAEPPPNKEAVGNDNATYISALEETVARLAMEREMAYAATNAATTKAAAMSPGNTLAANTLNDFRNQLLTEMRNEMKKVLVAAITAVATGSGARGGDTQKMEEKNAGAKPEVTSHYVPTAKGTESISQRIVSHYQQTQTRSPLTSLTGDTSMGKRWNDMSRGKIVIAQITSG
jgi:hypothetical protein